MFSAKTSRAFRSKWSESSSRLLTPPRLRPAPAKPGKTHAQGPTTQESTRAHQGIRAGSARAITGASRARQPRVDLWA